MSETSEFADGEMAMQVAEDALQAIAERRKLVGDVFKPVDTITKAQRLAIFALKRLRQARAALAATYQGAEAVELPELPEPMWIGMGPKRSNPSGDDSFSASQMREFALAAIALARKAGA